MNEIEFYYYVKALCILHNASVTSGRRTIGRNFSVGGAKASKHLVGNGFANDVALDVPERENTMHFVRDARALGLGVLVEHDHIHVQWPRRGDSR